MKVVMINDCAYVAETLLKNFPCGIEKLHLKRSRNFWDKTFGVSWRVLRAAGDIFHVHYLLQDCYMALKLGKRPVLGHAHGSDLRKSLHHPVWGRIVRHNLKNCGGVLVSTPDVLAQARALREDAEYLPNPVDSEFFYPKPIVVHEGRKRVLIASDLNWAVKGSDVAVRALAKIKDDIDVSIVAHGVDFGKTVALAKSLGLDLSVLPKVPHSKLNEYYWNADIVIDRFALGSLGMVSLEAIACGRPVVTYVSSKYPVYEDFPLKDLDQESMIAKIVDSIMPELWEQEYEYLTKNHGNSVIITRLLKIYKDCIEEASL